MFNIDAEHVAKVVRLVVKATANEQDEVETLRDVLGLQLLDAERLLRAARKPDPVVAEITKMALEDLF
jgi:hypothetical protein